MQDDLRPIYLDCVSDLTLEEGLFGLTVQAGRYRYRCILSLETAAEVHDALAAFFVKPRTPGGAKSHRVVRLPR